MQLARVSWDGTSFEEAVIRMSNELEKHPKPNPWAVSLTAAQSLFIYIKTHTKHGSIYYQILLYRYYAVSNFLDKYIT